ncbi:hypothetical protein [Deinococcus sp.]|uniref:hypothetical protein n=1 Tax=Deinococcus sp. TaxID=47478 RepID=UPI003CC654D3
MKRLALLLACFGSVALAGGGVAPGYFGLPFETWNCQSGQALQIVPTNTQFMIIRRYRGHSYALNFVPGVNGRYTGQGTSLDVRRNGDFELQLGRVHDVCSRPHARN